MITTPSDRFTAALTTSHTALTRVNHDGAELDVVAGSLTLTSKANVRATGSINLAAQWDTSVLEAITTGSHLTIERGIAFPDGSSEYVLLATVQVQEVRTDIEQRTASLSVADMGQAIEDYPLVMDYSATNPAGAQLSAQAAITDLLNQVRVGINVAFPVGASALIPAGTAWKAGASRWKAITDCAAIFGATIAQFGPNSTLHFSSVDPSPESVVTLGTGVGGVLVKADVSGSRRETYNAVVIEYGASDTEAGTVFLVDADQTSPTFWDGPWGRRPRPSEKVSVTTLAEAQGLAAQRLAAAKGQAVGVAFDAIWNPLLEPGDAVTIEGGVYVLDQITMPLDSGVMSAQARRVA